MMLKITCMVTFVFDNISPFSKFSIFRHKKPAYQGISPDTPVCVMVIKCRRKVIDDAISARLLELFEIPNAPQSQ